MIPNELINQPRWVLYRNYPRGDGQIGKKPIRVDGREANVADPNDWISYGEIADHVLDADGYGFVLTGSGYAGIDFDDCVENGQGVARSAIDR